MATPQPAGRTRLQRFTGALTPAEWRRAAGLAAAVIGLHVAGVVLLLAVVLPQDLRLGDGTVFGVGLGVTAYTLGMRHAFDADHIAAIDNVTRSLMGEGQRPLGVGFFFALGHSTVVFVLAALLALGIRGLGGAVEDDGSALQQATGVIGPAVSGAFLVLVGVLNLVVLVGVVRVFLRMRHGDHDEEALERRLAAGATHRLVGRATQTVRRPRQMYPLGLLFGLGFDTATEIALLATAGAAAAGGLPLPAILCLPVLFAAGMTLFDTIDGVFMTAAYGWAFTTPVRKVFYNITVTALSVAVALVIGTVELLTVLAEELDLTGGVWDVVAGVELDLVGYAIVVLFVVTWLAALTVWRVGRVEERWTAHDPGPGRGRR